MAIIVAIRMETGEGAQAMLNETLEEGKMSMWRCGGGRQITDQQGHNLDQALFPPIIGGKYQYLDYISSELIFLQCDWPMNYNTLQYGKLQYSFQVQVFGFQLSECYQPHVYSDPSGNARLVSRRNLRKHLAAIQTQDRKIFHV